MMYVYGMRLRGFSLGRQPMNGLRDRRDGTGRYHDILVYERQLNDEELRAYELDFLGTDEGLARAGSSNHNFLKEDV